MKKGIKLDKIDIKLADSAEVDEGLNLDEDNYGSFELSSISINRLDLSSTSIELESDSQSENIIDHADDEERVIEMLQEAEILKNGNRAY